MITKNALHHILRATSGITNETTFVIIGSAAIIPRGRGLPLEMLLTNEVDLFSPNTTDFALIADLIQGSLGEGSQFHKTFNYAADEVEPTTAKMPSDWQSRADNYTHHDCAGVTLIVPDPDDIAISKLVAWREKDQQWLIAGAKHKLISLSKMHDRLPLVPLDEIDSLSLSELERRLNALTVKLKQSTIDPPTNKITSARKNNPSRIGD